MTTWIFRKLIILERGQERINVREHDVQWEVFTETTVYI